MFSTWQSGPLARRFGPVGAVFVVLLCAEPALASLDIAELYVRKIREGERTFFQDGGWRQQRNQFELFYEADYILGAGTGDPRFVVPDSDEEDPLGAYSLGAIVLLTPPKSHYELAIYYLTSSTFQVDSGDDAFALLPLLAPFVPSAFAREDGLRVDQSLSGFQLRIGDWAEAAVGLLTDIRQGQEVVRAFFEYRVPVLNLEGDVIPNPDGGTERLRLAFFYDNSDYFSSVEVGYFSREVNERRRFAFAEVEQLFDMMSAGARFTIDGEFSSAFGGLHTSTFDNDDPRKGGKFGQAYDLVLQGHAVNPTLENLWSSSFGAAETLYGWKAEVYFQQPLMVWVGVVQLLFTASAAALTEDDKTRKELIDMGTDVASGSFDAADEDDSVYGGATFGISYNDPRLLRQVPGAAEHIYAYFKFRLLF